MHALLPIFPEESWVLESIRIRAGYVLTGKFDLNTDTYGKKKLRIQKCPDTCGRGLVRYGKSYRENIICFPFLFWDGDGWFNNGSEGGATVIKVVLIGSLELFIGLCFLYQRSE